MISGQRASTNVLRPNHHDAQCLRTRPWASGLSRGDKRRIWSSVFAAGILRRHCHVLVCWSARYPNSMKLLNTGSCMCPARAETTLPTTPGVADARGVSTPLPVGLGTLYLPQLIVVLS